MLSVLTNPTAIGAQGSVSGANNALAKTIKQLSTGLRINSAADDASGLAVSEKLRGQISGLKIASRNAQDGISFLQTAEASMGTMTSIVQRIRELAVQAGDPAYTASDRVMLQTEVDQLKSDINRISTSAEFNTKKLLNGDSAALWSATGNIEALVRGATIEGNYRVDSSLIPGTNNIYKTNIMNVREGAQSYDVMVAAGGIQTLNNITGTLGGVNVAITIGNSATFSALAADSATVTYTTGVSAAVTVNAGVGGWFSNGQAGSIEVRMLKSVSAGTTSATNAIEVRITNLASGRQSEWTTFNATVSNTGGLFINGTATTRSALFTSVGLTGAGAGAWSAQVTLTATATMRYNASASFGYNVLKTGATRTASGITSALIGQAGSGTFINNAGAVGPNPASRVGSYTVELEATNNKTIGSPSNIRYRVMNAETGAVSGWYNADVNGAGAITTPIGKEALESINLSGYIFTGGATVIFGTTFNSGDKGLVSVTGRQVYSAGTSFGGAGSVRFGANGPKVAYLNMANSAKEDTIKVYTAQMDEAGKAYYGSMDMTFVKAASTQTGTATIKFLSAGSAASEYTKLSDISSFYNSEGNSILENNQSLTMYGNGKQTTIYLDKADTIKTLQDKLRTAIVEGLEMGAEGANVNSNLAKFVSRTTKTPYGNQAVEGTIVFQGATLGNKSELAFSGNQNIINALGITPLQTASTSQLNVRVTNAHNGTFIGSGLVADGLLKGAIENVDIKIDEASASNVTWNASTNSLEFSPKGVATSFLHLKNNATVAAIGANQGQTIDLSIGRMDTLAMNIDDVNVLTIPASQKAITKLDEALDTINRSRAVVGAQMNRLQFTIDNLNVSRENMMAADSRIRDVDMAEAATNLTSNQVRLQAATAMLAQANQLPSYAAQLLK